MFAYMKSLTAALALSILIDGLLVGSCSSRGNASEQDTAANGIDSGG